MKNDDLAPLKARLDVLSVALHAVMRSMPYEQLMAVHNAITDEVGAMFPEEMQLPREVDRAVAGQLSLLLDVHSDRDPVQGTGSE